MYKIGSRVKLRPGSDFYCQGEGQIGIVEEILLERSFGFRWGVLWPVSGRYNYRTKDIYPASVKDYIKLCNSK